MSAEYGQASAWYTRGEAEAQMRAAAEVLRYFVVWTEPPAVVQEGDMWGWRGAGTPHVLDEALSPSQWLRLANELRGEVRVDVPEDHPFNRGVNHAAAWLAGKALRIALKEPRDHQCDGEVEWCDACEAKERAKPDPNRGRTEDVQ